MTTVNTIKVTKTKTNDNTILDQLSHALAAAHEARARVHSVHVVSPLAVHVAQVPHQHRVVRRHVAVRRIEVGAVLAVINDFFQ